MRSSPDQGLARAVADDLFLAKHFKPGRFVRYGDTWPRRSPAPLGLTRHDAPESNGESEQGASSPARAAPHHTRASL